MRIGNRLAAGLAAIGLGAIAAITGLQAGQEAAGAELTCEIRSSSVAGGVLLEAVALSTKKISGTYELTVRNDSPAGSSSTSQSGDFESTPGTETVLSEVALSDGGKRTASLHLFWSGGETSCALKE